MRFAPKLVELLESRHLQPVDAAHVLAPADDLPDEALHRVQRRAAGAVLGLGAAADVERIDEAEVHRRRDDRVPHPGLAGDHGVLVVAEAGQDVGEETGEDRLRLGRRGGVAEALQRTEMLGEQARHVGDGAYGVLVGRNEAVVRRREPLRHRLAVLLVEVPGAAFGLAVGVHEQAVALAHLAIKELHAEFLSALGPGGELRRGAEIAIVLADLERHV